ncbi:MAG: heme-binding protein [Alphaproteobacteria bacterium]|nr:heme-binding protein [Alphaproteobacteria bacterium]
MTTSRVIGERIVRAGLPAALAALALTSCGGGGSSSPSALPPSPPIPPAGVYPVPASKFLSTTDVERILSQGLSEANARGLKGVIAVTDRVGNVLAVVEMIGAAPTVRIRPSRGVDTDAQGLLVPRAAAAISKALTGAYLSSGGNAFSSRTASMIVQETFPPSPATGGLESGPLFGVQFSSLPCSDLSSRFVAGQGVTAGPHRAPLGLSADPGGFPLYKDGVVVGGVGVSADDDYGFDPDVLDIDGDADEFIALAATDGFAAPESIRAPQIAVDGVTLRFSDASASGLRVSPAASQTLSSFIGTSARLLSVPGYFADTPLVIRAGVTYGTEASGIRRAGAGPITSQDAFVISDGAGGERFPVRAGGAAVGGARPLTQAEAATILNEALGVMSDARAQIRRPLNSRAEVTISIVDTDGAVLGIVRSPDAPVFGIDVSLQKARSAAFMSHPLAGADLQSAMRNPVLAGTAVPDTRVRGFASAFSGYSPTGLSLTGTIAMSARALGNLARPHFPDGELAAGPGPLSPASQNASPFSTGLQSALIVGDLAQHLSFVSDPASTSDVDRGCAFVPDAPSRPSGQNRLSNGLQIFPGGFPIYRGDKLIGAIGVSGDGIDQDDMIALLGVARAAARIAGTDPPSNAPRSLRADQAFVNGVRLRYASCPFSPLLSSAAQNVCDGQ